MHSLPRLTENCIAIHSLLLRQRNNLSAKPALTTNLHIHIQIIHLKSHGQLLDEGEWHLGQCHTCLYSLLFWYRLAIASLCDGEVVEGLCQLLNDR